MKKIFLILTLGVLLLAPEAQAQRIEYDSTGIPRACTNYDLHMKQANRLHVGRLAVYAGVVVGVVYLNYAIHGRNSEWGRSVNHLGNQSLYALSAAVGACLVVGIYKLDVHLKNRAGL